MNKFACWPCMVWLLLLTLGAVVHAWFLQEKLAAVERQLALSAPIAVIDFAATVLALGPNATEQEIEHRLLATNQQIEKLMTAGFIVLDAQAVVAADEAMFVPLKTQEDTHGSAH